MAPPLTTEHPSEMTSSEKSSLTGILIFSWAKPDGITSTNDHSDEMTAFGKSYLTGP